MADKYRGYYVNRDIIRGWSDDGKSVMWCNSVKGEEGRSVDVDSLYYLEISSFPENLAVFIHNEEECFHKIITSLRSGEKTALDMVDTDEREPFFFEYLRALSSFKTGYARYMGEKVLKLMNEYKGLDYYTVIEPTLNTVIDNFKTAADFGPLFSLPIIDLKCRILHAPEGKSFIVGATPINVINPYFEKKFVKYSNEDRPTVLKGTVMILPISPDKSVCLYDSGIYEFREGDEETTVISESDVDLLNRLQIFTSEIDGGVVYSGDMEPYIKKLTQSFTSKPYRTGYEWLRADRYPFWTMLSVLKIRDDAQKELQKNVKDPLRPITVAVKEYDAEIERRTGKNTVNKDSLFERYKCIRTVLEEIEEEENSRH